MEAVSDTVFYSIFPDPALTLSESSLEDLKLQILHFLSPSLAQYIWQHQPFNLNVSSSRSSCPCIPKSNPNSPRVPHLHGRIRYDDNLEDEWFVVFLLFEISRNFNDVSIRAWDTDGEFLLIETAFYLPRWIKPENSHNRVFIRRGELHIIPLVTNPNSKNSLCSAFQNPILDNSLGLRFALEVISKGTIKTRASDEVQEALNRQIRDYPKKALENMHTVQCRVPLSVAQVLKHEPCLISLAVGAFYDRDIDSMKFASKMAKFLGNGEMVDVSLRMSRAMYAQLMGQNFANPKTYPMPTRSEGLVFKGAEFGMKIACGFEMMYQQRQGFEEEGETNGSFVGEGKNETNFMGVLSKGRSGGDGWEVFKKSLESRGYFKGLLPGSKEYHRLMDEAFEHYKNTELYSRSSAVMLAPVKRIDEILSLPYFIDEFTGLDLPPSDDDAWLYNGEAELNSAMLERQKEIVLYESKRQKHQKAKEQVNNCASSSQTTGFNLGDVATSMQAFVDKVSSYEGAEVPTNRESKDVEFNVDQFIKEMESVLRNGQQEGSAGGEYSEGSYTSSDMHFDELDDGESSDSPCEQQSSGDTFMHSYTDALNAELKTTTLGQSFVRADNEEWWVHVKSSARLIGMASASGDANGDDDFTPVDIDVNLVQSLLESFSSQQGLPGPTSNLLGLMGLQLPRDSREKK
ncbi:hypothetical protein AMTRI_Chr02g213290 [Amborella trichopoda]